MSECKNCGHEIIGKLHYNPDFDIKGLCSGLQNDCSKASCGCTSPEPESENIVVEYNKNPHGKAEFGVTEAEVRE